MNFVDAVTELVFVDEGVGELKQPDVIVETLAQPDVAGVVTMGRFVSRSAGRARDVGRRALYRHSPVARVEQLAGFQYHLDNVFINVILRA